MALVYEMATDIALPDITVYRKLYDGVLSAYELRANEGYVMYDKNAKNEEHDPDDFEIIIPVTYYYTKRTMSKAVPVEKWGWVAVPRDSVDENYIFGGGDTPVEM